MALRAYWLLRTVCSTQAIPVWARREGDGKRAGLMQPLPAEKMGAVAVSTLVNNPKNERPG